MTIEECIKRNDAIIEAYKKGDRDFLKYEIEILKYYGYDFKRGKKWKKILTVYFMADKRQTNMK